MSAAHGVSIAGFFGSSGSGKSSRIKLELAAAKPRRLVVWDTKHEWAPLGLTSFDSLGAMARAMLKAKRFAFAFHPIRTPKAMRAQFSTWCKIADQAGDLVCVAEELADVTLPGWAPDGWSMLTRQGRHSAMKIYGTSQSPALVDKTFFGNCSRLSCGVLGTLSDVKTMAGVLMIDKAEILALESMHYIDLMKSPRLLTRGVTDIEKIKRLRRIA